MFILHYIAVYAEQLSRRLVILMENSDTRATGYLLKIRNDRIRKKAQCLFYTTG